MGIPSVQIDVDDSTGEWRVDGMPMVLVPRHFLLNQHHAIEAALGRDPLRKLLHDSGYRSAWEWCAKQAIVHGLRDFDVVRHYLKRLSQRGWGQFKFIHLNESTGQATIEVRHSIYATNRSHADEPMCYAFAGWFCGALEWALAEAGRPQKLQASEVACGHEHGGPCRFQIDQGAT